MADRGRKAFPVSSHVCNERWVRHCQELHKQRLANVRPSIDTEAPQLGDGVTLVELRKTLGSGGKRAQLKVDRQAKMDRENEILMDKMIKIQMMDTSQVFRPFMARSTFQWPGHTYVDTATGMRCMDTFNATCTSSPRSIHYNNSRPYSAPGMRITQRDLNIQQENTKLLTAIANTRSKYSVQRLEKKHWQTSTLLERISNYRGPANARYVPSSRASSARPAGRSTMASRNASPFPEDTVAVTATASPMPWEATKALASSRAAQPLETYTPILASSSAQRESFSSRQHSQDNNNISTAKASVEQEADGEQEEAYEAEAFEAEAAAEQQDQQSETSGQPEEADETEVGAKHAEAEAEIEAQHDEAKSEVEATHEAAAEEEEHEEQQDGTDEQSENAASAKHESEAASEKAENEEASSHGDDDVASQTQESEVAGQQEDGEAASEKEAQAAAEEQQEEEEEQQEEEEEEEEEVQQADADEEASEGVEQVELAEEAEAEEEYAEDTTEAAVAAEDSI